MSIVLIAASVAAAVIHFALGPEHAAELGWLGAGFYAAGALQLGWAGLAVLATLRRGAPRPWTSALLPAGIGINVAILAAWVISRTVGLPAGDQPWTPEAIGISDAITAILEGAVVLGLVRERRGRAADLAPASVGPTDGHPALLGAAPVLALILVAAVVAVGAPHAHADGETHDAPSGAVEARPHGH